MLYLSGELEKWLGKYALLEVVGITQTPPNKIPCDVISLRPYIWYSDYAIDDISAITNAGLETVDFYVGDGRFIESKSFMPMKCDVELYEMKCISKVPLGSGEIQNREVGNPSNATISKLIANTLDYYSRGY